MVDTFISSHLRYAILDMIPVFKANHRKMGIQCEYNAILTCVYENGRFIDMKYSNPGIPFAQLNEVVEQATSECRVDYGQHEFIVLTFNV